MATHFCILAWEIPSTEEPVRLQSMGSQRVRHRLVTKQQPQTVAFWKAFILVCLVTLLL